MNKILILIMATLLSSCASTIQSPTNMASNPENKDGFKRLNYVERQADHDKFNMELLKREQEGNARNIAYHLTSESKRSPQIAKYLIDNRLIRGNINSYAYANSIALRTIIQSGEMNPYLKTYWDSLINESNAVNWYTVEFAVGASVYAANNENNAYAQKMLALYSMHSCPTEDLKNGHSIHGRKIGQDPLLDALGTCKDYPNEAAQWAGKFLANQVSPIAKTGLMEQMADFYFSRKEYKYAAGYYKLLLEIQNNTMDMSKLVTLRDNTGLRDAFGADTSINRYLKELINGSSRKELSKNNKAFNRLQLISNAGITSFDNYGL